MRGRTAHESVFNINDGDFRCPSHAAGLLARSARGPAAWPGRCSVLPSSWNGWRRARMTSSKRSAAATRSKRRFLSAARATCDFYIAKRPPDGVPYWDTGAPGLAKLGDYLHRPADPFNDHEPVDSSAAAIAAQGLLRLGHYLVHEAGETKDGVRYVEAGLTIVHTLLDEPYLSTSPRAPGTDPALGLSSAERLGLRPARPQGAVRRIQHVGRLPRPRSRPVRRAPGRERAVLHLFRTRHWNRLTTEARRSQRRVMQECQEGVTTLSFCKSLATHLLTALCALCVLCGESCLGK